MVSVEKTYAQTYKKIIWLQYIEQEILPRYMAALDLITTVMGRLSLLLKRSLMYSQ